MLLSHPRGRLFALLLVTAGLMLAGVYLVAHWLDDNRPIVGTTTVREGQRSRSTASVAARSGGPVTVCSTGLR